MMREHLYFLLISALALPAIACEVEANSLDYCLDECEDLSEACEDNSQEHSCKSLCLNDDNGQTQRPSRERYDLERCIDCRADYLSEVGLGATYESLTGELADGTPIFTEKPALALCNPHWFAFQPTDPCYQDCRR